VTRRCENSSTAAPDRIGPSVHEPLITIAQVSGALRQLPVRACRDAGTMALASLNRFKSDAHQNLMFEGERHVHE